MAEANQPVVIDSGSGLLKAGFAGSDKPRLIFRSCVGRVKHSRVMLGGALDGQELFIGNKVDEHRGALRISYPMENGIVRDWQDMERLWSSIYGRDGLNVDSMDHAVLLTESALNPHTHREKTAEYFFEALNVPALHCSIQAILSLYASGRTTGVVLDIGDGVTSIVPIYEGLALPHAISRSEIAGRHVTDSLQLQLRRSGHIFHTSAEREIVRQIKETHAAVSFTSQSKKDSDITSVSSSTSAATVSSSARNTLAVKPTYRLPDGSSIELGSELYRAPEVLFAPEMIGSEYRGVHELLVHSVMRCDIDLRRSLLSQVVLSGGTTLLPGFAERLLSEVRRHPMAPKDAKIRIAAPPERLYTTWIGGSILASLSTFKHMWVSKADYLEHGARILTNKAL